MSDAFAPSPSAAQRHGGSPRVVLERAIERLEQLVAHETAALEQRQAIDLKDLNNRKSQGLLDFNRALRHLDRGAMDATLEVRLAGLRAKLEANRAALALHLEAVREVAAILADTIRDAESDGTYSRRILGAGQWQ
jgi:hypothetical protein